MNWCTFDLEITPTRLRTIKRQERALYAARVAAARAAHALPSDTGWGCAREDAIAVWWTAKLDHRRAAQALRAALLLPCVKGSHVSPAAKARLIRNGTWRA